MTPSMIIARLNDRARPMDRGDIYEDPLDDLLKEKGLGEVTGGGTQFGENNEVTFVDIEISLNGGIESGVKFVTSALEQLGAPKGSRILANEGTQAVAFGHNEGLAIYLNGTDLPDAVYEQSDINFVFEEINRLLSKEGSIHSYWDGPAETALYLYGSSFAKMSQAIQEFIGSYPLCQKARLVQIA